MSLHRAFQRLLSPNNIQHGLKQVSRRSRSTAVPSSPSTGALSTPLSEPLPGIPAAQFVASGRDKKEETKVTVLENGIRVASEEKYGQFCTVGVCIDSGSRYEVAYPSGISHFLEKLAFNSTPSLHSKDEILQKLEKYGGICDCQSTRDTFLYAASVDVRGLDTTLDILGDVVLRPLFTDDEILMCQNFINFELEDIAMRPDQEPLLVEGIHAAAYRDNTLGLPKICPDNNLEVINRKALYSYLACYHKPERIVIAGVGVNHDELVEATQKHFVDKAPIWTSENIQKMETDRSVAQYTGGLVEMEKDLSNASLGPTPMPDLGHVVIGLESVGHQHDDFIAYCVLNMMMGGGGSFSAGGPGKGMYTRLYTNVLNRHYWMYGATAYNHAYSDSGIFCINASAPPSQMNDLIQVLVREFVAITGSISDSEFNRAKTQLKSMLLMNLESRPVIFEDIARQVLAQGHRKQPAHFISQIDKVTKDDLNRIGTKMLASKPSVAAIGNLKNLPKFEDICDGLLHKQGMMPKKRFRLFQG